MAKTASSSSLESVKNSEYQNCFCGRRARIYTSWTLKNPGRRFYTCFTPKEANGCHFFQWFDECFTGRALDVITHLNHRRLYLEEKLKLVEENLAEKAEKKRGLKADMKDLLAKKMALKAEKNMIRRQLKLTVIVDVVGFMILFIFK